MKLRSVPIIATLAITTCLLYPSAYTSAAPTLSQEKLKEAVELPGEIKPLHDASKQTKELEERFSKIANNKGEVKASSISEDIIFELEPNDSMDWADWLPLDHFGAGVFDTYGDLDFFEVDFPAEGDVNITTASSLYADHVVPVAFLIKPNGEIVEMAAPEVYADEELKYVFESIPNVSPGTHYVALLNAVDDYDPYEPYLFDVQFTEDQTGTVIFPDVKGTWAEPYVSYLHERGLVHGYPNGLFGLNDSITRAEAATVLVRELGLPLQSPEFKDVSSEHWAADFIGAMQAEGYLTGYEDGTFKPNAFLTREEMAALLVRSYQISGSHPVPFSDVPKSSWSYKYIESLVANEITTGYPDGTFRPKANISRGEFAALMARLLSDEF